MSFDWLDRLNQINIYTPLLQLFFKQNQKLYYIGEHKFVVCLHFSCLIYCIILLGDLDVHSHRRLLCALNLYFLLRLMRRGLLFSLSFARLWIAEDAAFVWLNCLRTFFFFTTMVANDFSTSIAKCCSALTAIRIPTFTVVVLCLFCIFNTRMLAILRPTLKRLRLNYLSSGSIFSKLYYCLIFTMPHVFPDFSDTVIFFIVWFNFFSFRPRLELNFILFLGSHLNYTAISWRIEGFTFFIRKPSLFLQSSIPLSLFFGAPLFCIQQVLISLFFVFSLTGCVFKRWLQFSL